MADILIVDDDEVLCSMLTGRLNDAGYSCRSATTLGRGLELAFAEGCEVVFLDVRLPDGNGLEYVHRFRAAPAAPEIIIMTGSGDSDGAQKAISSGAWSYLEKPHVLRDLLLPLTRALQYREEKKRCPALPVALKREGIVGNSGALNACLDQLAHAASSDAAVLITGETGTGKEVFARTLHLNSERAAHNFVVVDCASLPDTLIESTLFGHLKGSYTGADTSSLGLIQLADQGTLFLDEIGELPLELQKKFLRVLQEHRYRPVGSTTENSSDFRVVAATNCDLEQQVQAGKFREDLFFRLRSFAITLPPLRQRSEDIHDLAHHILSRLCERRQIPPKALSTEFVEHLEGYGWPGNIRELKQLLEEVFARASQHQTLFAFHLPQELRISGARSKLSSSPGAAAPAPGPNLEKPLSWKEYKAAMESQYMAQLMSYCGGDIKKACQVSAISRARLYQLLRKNKPASVS
ncbi:sigma-54-dependent transcriptional regulator [Desulfogranum mediterraneum]|uniref:sigma-54-dependent transcriptional regulator n=1 Tax=Desulfogranum mediterraneum TaxID=160661 RepID=UPI0004034FFC|nr:sigma-54 dependent transcriptional regulator [Desulfogranum mediterraneum]